MKSRRLLFIVFIFAVIFLAACGGGDEETVVEIDYGIQCLQDLKGKIWSFIPAPEDRANLPLSCQVYYGQDDVKNAQATVDGALQSLNESATATLRPPLPAMLTSTPESTSTPGD